MSSLPSALRGSSDSPVAGAGGERAKAPAFGLVLAALPAAQAASKMRAHVSRRHLGSPVCGLGLPSGRRLAAGRPLGEFGEFSSGWPARWRWRRSAGRRACLLAWSPGVGFGAAQPQPAHATGLARA